MRIMLESHLTCARNTRLLSADIELTPFTRQKSCNGGFWGFWFFVAMDADNYAALTDACPEEYKDKISYFLDYAPQLNTREVPDPYFGENMGFEQGVGYGRGRFSRVFIKGCRKQGASMKRLTNKATSWRSIEYVGYWMMLLLRLSLLWWFIVRP